MSRELLITLIILAITIAGFFSGKFKLGVVGMTAATLLCITGVLSVQEAYAYFSNQNMVMVVAFFILGGSLTKTHFVDHLRVWLFKHAGNGTRLVAMYLLACALLVQLLLPTPLISVMIPFMDALDPDGDVQPANLLFPGTVVAHAAQNAVPLGMGLTMFAMLNTYLESYGITQQLGVFDVIKVAIVPFLVMYLYFVFIGWKLFPKKNIDRSKIAKAKEKDPSQYLSPAKEKLVYFLFLLSMVLLAFSSHLPFPMYIIPVIADLILLYTKTIDHVDVKNFINMDTVFMLGGVLSLASAMAKTGAGDWLSGVIVNLLGGHPTAMQTLIAFYFVTAILTQLMSNAATMNVFAPLAVAVAVNQGFNPLTFVVAICIGANSAMLTPMASPSCAVAFGAGNYSMKDVFKASIPIFFIYSFVVILMSSLVFPL